MLVPHSCPFPEADFHGTLPTRHTHCTLQKAPGARARVPPTRAGLEAANGGGRAAGYHGGHSRPAEAPERGAKDCLGGGHRRLPCQPAAWPRAAGAFTSPHCGDRGDASPRARHCPTCCRRRRLPPAATHSELPSLPALWLQVRSSQLDKEASELRAENETLLRTVEEQKHSAVQSAQVGGQGCGWLPACHHSSAAH